MVILKTLMANFGLLTSSSECISRILGAQLHSTSFVPGETCFQMTGIEWENTGFWLIPKIDGILNFFVKSHVFCIANMACCWVTSSLVFFSPAIQEKQPPQILLQRA